MIASLILFENEFLNIVSISFTALILNELIMVALEITTWHMYMVIAEVVTLMLYVVSMTFLPEYFGASIILASPLGGTVGSLTEVCLQISPLFCLPVSRGR